MVLLDVVTRNSVRAWTCVPVSICYSTMLSETKPSGGIPWPALVPDCAAWPVGKVRRCLLSMVLCHSTFAGFPLMWCIEWWYPLVFKSTPLYFHNIHPSGWCSHGNPSVDSPHQSACHTLMHFGAQTLHVSWHMHKDIPPCTSCGFSSLAGLSLNKG